MKLVRFGSLICLNKRARGAQLYCTYKQTVLKTVSLLSSSGHEEQQLSRHNRLAKKQTKLSIVNLRSSKSCFASLCIFGTVSVKQLGHFYGHLWCHCAEGVVGNSNKFSFQLVNVPSVAQPSAPPQCNSKFRLQLWLSYADLLLTRLLPRF